MDALNAGLNQSSFLEAKHLRGHNTILYLRQRQEDKKYLS